MRTVRNVYACLVHERQECVVDLVRNLRYLDPDSHILLYNGGNDAALLDGGFPWQNYRAVVHPRPRAMAWGRLHDFALDCMRFALGELPFDTLTIVDSDQLALRAGYPARLSRFLADEQGVGMLGNSPAPQTWDTHIAPARAALREVELWRHFLRRFEGGEEKFVHWSFWPSTVFTADAARALTALFDTDAELQEIMRRTKIWATEEVILPTLLALLGFGILANPCSDDYLKFRVRFTPRQLDAALAREDVFWVHPVARNDRDGLRRHIRARLNQYEKPFEEGAVMPSNDATQPAAQGSGLLLTLPILERMKTVEGWLWEDEADLLIAATSRALTDLPAPHKIVEVGSYCGRSTVVFGSVVRALRPDAKVYAVDPHDGCVGATDQRITKTAPTLEKFRWNIRNAGLTETVELIRKYSHEVEWRDPISLLFIDGLHDYTNVARDFFHFERFVVEGGYVAFHDYADYYPGVKTFVNEVIGSERYRKVHCAMSMIVVQKLRAAESSGDAGNRQQQQLAEQPAAGTSAAANVAEPPIAARPPAATAAAEQHAAEEHAAAAERRAAVRLTSASRHAAPIPKAPRGERFDRLSAFRGVHEGESVIVCGCGESLNELERPEEFLTVGVNDVGRRFQPNYLVVVNPRNQFKGDRFRYVEQSRADYLFTQLSLGLPNRNVIRFRLGSYGGTDFANPDVLHYTQNSPYVALCLAAHMGARRVGLIGVDFTDHHFFARTGRHALAAQLKTIDEQYRRLGAALAARGVEVFNLSRASRLTAFPKLSIAEFAARSTRKAEAEAETGERAPLKIVSYATTPVAGVPAILARCIKTKTPHAARCVWAASGYGNGVTFDGDIEWSQSPARANEELESADVVIVHNGKVEPRHRKLVAGKAVVTMAHNYLWNVDRTYVKQGFPGVVVGQYQATLAEFEGWSAVPNPVPIWEPQFQPGDKGEAVAVCYTPSGKHERYAPSHRLYWHSKGYDTTMRVLDRLAARLPVRLEAIRDRQVSHAESLAMKRRSHVVIDECVTGSYHRNSLEGLSAGCVVVNGVGLLPAVREVFRLCSGDDANPFVFANLGGLEGALAALVERGAAALAADGAQGRLWMERRWDFARQWETFWSPVIDRALRHAGRKTRSLEPAARAATSHEARPSRAPSGEEVAGQATARPETSGQDVPLARPAANAAGADAELSAQLARASTRGTVSVVIPHGGRDRLRNLTATLSNLRACPDVGEVIVVDTGAAPTAEAAARRLADKYLFVRHVGLFNRARALNAGAALAECEHLLWQDNDLISAPDFPKKALEELAARGLDCLLPWTSIRYLSQGDSGEVSRGARRAADCRPAHVWTNRHAVGGAMLVRKEFVQRYGGMCEEFEGWGGEDNAWFHKAKVLGRLGITRRTDQHLFHLYHDKSGGYHSTTHTEKNPRYNTNLALLLATRRLTDRARFLRRFPPPKHFSCPWETHKRLAFLGAGSGAEATLRVEAARALSALYGIEVEHAVAASASARDERPRGTPDADALVIFGAAAALRFLSDDSCESFRPRTLVVHDAPPMASLSPVEAAQLRRARAHLTPSAETGRVLAEAGLTPWVAGGRFEETGERAVRLALALAQPLSLMLADVSEDPAADGAEDSALKVLAETRFGALAGAELIHTTNSREHGL